MTKVNVLIANENEKVKECVVIPYGENNLEFGLRHALFDIYGVANVCSCSCEIGHIPSNIAQFLAEKSICVNSKRWSPYSVLSSKIKTGERYLVKLANDWVCCATYCANNGHPIWKGDNGQEIISVVSYKELEE